MTYKSLLAATLLFAIGGPALAQQGQMPAQGGAPVPAQSQRPNPFERADANKDGVITLEEVRVVRTSAFTRLDTNRDGFLVREEMPRPQRRRDGAITPATQHITVRSSHVNYMAADINKDGSITRAEFDTTFPNSQSSNVAETPRYRSSAFTFLDTDQNGIVSQAEVTAASARSGWPPKQRQPGEVTSSGQAMARANRPPRPTPDTNNDQKISLAEWLARPDPLFDRGDTNKDGRITREEAAAIVRQGRGEGGRSMRPW